jgi:hypothetical protein
VRIILVVVSVGCINSFRGANVQIDLSPATPTQATPGAMPTSTELPSNSHFRLYAFEHDATAGRLFEIQKFEVHRIVNLASPCFIDVGAHVSHPGLHVSQYAKVILADTGITDIANPPPTATEQQKIEAATALQRQANVNALAGDGGIKAVTSHSVDDYPPVGADCSAPLPPPTCTDNDSNTRRLAACQAFWTANPDHFEGTDRVLTSPLNGSVHGMVDGTNPINLAPVGGAQFFPDVVLNGFDGYALYWQYNPGPDGKPAYPASVPDSQRSEAGQLLMFGNPEMLTRGVLHVHMTSVSSPALTANLAIFPDLANNDDSF